jgi:aminoglycoside phosphotransferase (APT) family kinase protein
VLVDQYAFVPADGGLLAVACALPHVSGGWEVAEADLRALLPGDPRYLRLAGQAEVAPEHILRLRVFAHVDARGIPPAEIAVPEPLRSAFDQCVAELHGAPVPEGRAAWAREGWHEQAETWAGMPLEQVRNWPLSAVLRNGEVWFKAVFPLFHHEPAITAAIGLPRVLRADHERGWMLLEEARGEPGRDHEAALRALARVHREWSTRIDEALALGAPDRRAPSALPPTLIHGDFHPGNVLGSTIIDWSDAAVANPLHDVNHYLLNVDDEAREPLLLAYGEAYGADVRQAADSCEAESYEYIAQSYVGITATLPEDEKWWFAGEESRWLRRASDVRAGKRPSRDT